MRVVHIAQTGEEQILNRYLNRERLHVPVTRLSRKQHFRSKARDWPAPLLVLAQNDTIVWVMNPPGDPTPNVHLLAALDSLGQLPDSVAGTAP
jgi:hypothetical protein